MSRNVRKRTFRRAPSEDLEQPAQLYILTRILNGTFWIAKDSKFLHADNEDSDQTAQADLSLCWALMSEGTFSHVTAQILNIR